MKVSDLIAILATLPPSADVLGLDGYPIERENVEYYTAKDAELGFAGSENPEGLVTISSYTEGEEAIAGNGDPKR